MRPISGYKGGFTVAEVLVASGTFLLILGTLVAVFYQSTAVMMKGTSQSSLQRDAQVFAIRLSQFIHYGARASLTVAADQSGLSLLASDDPDGKFRYDPSVSQALWSNYEVFYFDSARKEILNRQVSVLGFPQEATPGPIESFDAAQPLTTYFTGGKPILRNVESAAFQESLPGLIKVVVHLSRDDTRKQGAEVYNFSLSESFRN